MLAAKEKHLAEIKRKLGISSLQELKQNISKGWQDVTSTNAYVALLQCTLVRDTDIPEFLQSGVWTELSTKVLKVVLLVSGIRFP